MLISYDPHHAKTRKKTALPELLTQGKYEQLFFGNWPPSLSGQISVKPHTNFPNINKPTEMFAI